MYNPFLTPWVYWIPKLKPTIALSDVQNKKVLNKKKVTPLKQNLPKSPKVIASKVTKTGTKEKEHKNSLAKENVS